MNQILFETKITPREEGYDPRPPDVAAFVTELTRPRDFEKVDNAFCRSDDRGDRSENSSPLDAVLHTDKF
ncbi:hypothetical protein [Bradyrhizobium cenepequi]|uniref:hypothetical protein n=1 Tax=Bradyrhizobium cenepequi TaxID=2821403 RepID=UPI001CE36C5E|nr:hypothetical protein [Bradyrhizobium cenepequi]MCA6107959.1 hypothetical protein [Bradyrhizobium cenepequi]